MKTTIEIPEPMLREVKRLASKEGTTIKALILESLRRILGEKKQKTAFRLRKATFKGNGLQPAVSASQWEQIRQVVYEGRGG